MRKESLEIRKIVMLGGTKMDDYEERNSFLSYHLKNNKRAPMRWLKDYLEDTFNVI